jgi:hypothetical protein
MSHASHATYTQKARNVTIKNNKQQATDENVILAYFEGSLFMPSM